MLNTYGPSETTVLVSAAELGLCLASDPERKFGIMAHFLGQETIAESVENDGIITMLEEIGVDYLQGWGIGKPKPLDQVTHDLANLEQ